MTRADATRTFGAVIYENFELLDLFGPLEMFGYTAPDVKIVIVAEKSGPIRSAQGPKTLADYGFAECPHLDLILVPGGIGTIKQLNNDSLLQFLGDRSASTEVIMSVCSGSAILAKAGLLNDRRATSNKQFFSLVQPPGNNFSLLCRTLCNTLL